MLSSIPITISDNAVWDSICHISRFIISSSRIPSEIHTVNMRDHHSIDQTNICTISSPLIFCQRHIKKRTALTHTGKKKNKPSNTWHMNVQHGSFFSLWLIESMPLVIVFSIEFLIICSMNVLNIVSILLNNNVKSIRWPFFHYSPFLYDVIIRSNEKKPTEKEALWWHSNNDRFHIKVSIYVTVLSARFFLLLLLMFHFEWTNRWIRKCCCHFFCCCWFRAHFDTE